jgi:hypothetical protein
MVEHKYGLNPSGIIPHFSSFASQFNGLDTEQFGQSISDCDSNCSCCMAVAERLPFQIAELELYHIGARFVAECHSCNCPRIRNCVAEAVSGLAAKLEVSARIRKDVRQVTI